MHAKLSLLHLAASAPPPPPGQLTKPLRTRACSSAFLLNLVAHARCWQGELGGLQGQCVNGSCPHGALSSSVAGAGGPGGHGALAGGEVRPGRGHARGRDRHDAPHGGRHALLRARRRARRRLQRRRLLPRAARAPARGRGSGRCCRCSPQPACWSSLGADLAAVDSRRQLHAGGGRGGRRRTACGASSWTRTRPSCPSARWTAPPGRPGHVLDGDRGRPGHEAGPVLRRGAVRRAGHPQHPMAAQGVRD